MELKPCPFCGNNVARKVLTSEEMNDEIKPVYDFENYIAPEDQFVVCCDFHAGGCGACGGWQSSVEDAAKLWNKRKK